MASKGKMGALIPFLTSPEALVEPIMTKNAVPPPFFTSSWGGAEEVMRHIQLWFETTPVPLDLLFFLGEPDMSNAQNI